MCDAAKNKRDKTHCRTHCHTNEEAKRRKKINLPLKGINDDKNSSLTLQKICFSRVRSHKLFKTKNCCVVFNEWNIFTFHQIYPLGLSIQFPITFYFGVFCWVLMASRNSLESVCAHMLFTENFILLGEMYAPWKSTMVLAVFLVADADFRCPLTKRYSVLCIPSMASITNLTKKRFQTPLPLGSAFFISKSKITE